MHFVAGLKGYDTVLVDETVDEYGPVICRFNIRDLQQPLFTHRMDTDPIEDIRERLRSFGNQLASVEEQLKEDEPPKDMVLTTFRAHKNAEPIDIPYLRMVISQLHDDNLAIFITDGTGRSCLRDDVPARINACIDILKDLCASTTKVPAIVYYAVLDPRVYLKIPLTRVTYKDVTATNLRGCNRTGGECGCLDISNNGGEIRLGKRVTLSNGGEIRQGERVALKTQAFLYGVFRCYCEETEPVSTNGKSPTNHFVVDLSRFLAGAANAALSQQERSGYTLKHSTGLTKKDLSSIRNF